MRPTPWLIACLAMAVGCRRSSGDPAPVPAVTSASDPAPAASPPAPATDRSPYTSDIENLCDAIARSGADQLPASDRQLTIATWLGSHLQTEDAHRFLVKIQPLQGEAKATALDAEAQRLGLPGCALAAQWRTPVAAPATSTPSGS